MQHEISSLKHHPAPKSKHAQPAKKNAKHSKTRKWSPDSDVALCSARAVAEAIRLLSGPVLTDADVLALYWSTACDPDAGQTLSDALRVACDVFGVAADGVRFGSQRVGDVQDFDRLPSVRAEAVRHVAEPVIDAAQADRVPQIWGHPLILGLDLPWGEPHAVTVDIDGTWWSWGEPHTAADFPGAVIDEAWAVMV